MYLGSVLVATYVIVSLHQKCWRINTNPRLDIEYDSNGSGIAPKIEHWYLFIKQKIVTKSALSRYNSGKDLPRETEVKL